MAWAGLGEDDGDGVGWAVGRVRGRMMGVGWAGGQAQHRGIIYVLQTQFSSFFFLSNL